jgi:hypothetical protein
VPATAVFVVKLSICRSEAVRVSQRSLYNYCIGQRCAARGPGKLLSSRFYRMGRNLRVKPGLPVPVNFLPDPTLETAYTSGLWRLPKKFILNSFETDYVSVCADMSLNKIKKYDRCIAFAHLPVSLHVTVSMKVRSSTS